MLTIRLSRVGKKNKPTYRLVISEKARDPYGRALEFLGSYDPHTKKLEVKADRIKHWLKNGSGMSPAVNNLLVKNSIIEGKIVKATKGEIKEAEKQKEKAEKTEEKSDEQVKVEKSVDSTPLAEDKKEEVKKSLDNEKAEVSQKSAESKIEGQASTDSPKTEAKA